MIEKGEKLGLTSSFPVPGRATHMFSWRGSKENDKEQFQEMPRLSAYIFKKTKTLFWGKRSWTASLFNYNLGLRNRILTNDNAQLCSSFN